MLISFGRELDPSSPSKLSNEPLDPIDRKIKLASDTNTTNESVTWVIINQSLTQIINQPSNCRRIKYAELGQTRKICKSSDKKKERVSVCLSPPATSSI